MSKKLLLIALNKPPWSKLRILLSDQYANSVFNHHGANTIGDRFDLPKDGHNNYLIKIHEEIHLEGDPNYPCVDYNEAGGYHKCLEEEYSRKLNQYINCTPPWFTNKEELWCKNGLSIELENRFPYLNFMADFFFGQVDTGTYGTMISVSWLGQMLIRPHSKEESLEFDFHIYEWATLNI